MTVKYSRKARLEVLRALYALRSSKVFIPIIEDLIESGLISKDDLSLTCTGLDAIVTDSCHRAYLLATDLQSSQGIAIPPFTRWHCVACEESGLTQTEVIIAASLIQTDGSIKISAYFCKDFHENLRKAESEAAAKLAISPTGLLFKLRI